MIAAVKLYRCIECLHSLFVVIQVIQGDTSISIVLRNLWIFPETGKKVIYCGSVITELYIDLAQYIIGKLYFRFILNGLGNPKSLLRLLIDRSIFLTR